MRDETQCCTSKLISDSPQESMDMRMGERRVTVVVNRAAEPQMTTPQRRNNQKSHKHNREHERASGLVPDDESDKREKKADVQDRKAQLP